MKRNEVRIDELRLRIPGLSAAQARMLAENIAQRVAGRLPAETGVGAFGAVQLRVRVPEGSSPDRVEAAVVNSILRWLAP